MSSKISGSYHETISAFSNEPGCGGGYMLLGVALAEDSLFPVYEVIGVDDPDKIQSDLATQCRTLFNVPVRPEITVEVAANGKVVVVAFIPEAQEQEKPIYIAARGLPRGAFRRIGSTDQQCTDDDLQIFFQSRSHLSFDASIARECEIEDLDQDSIRQYRDVRREANPEAPELNYDDRDLLRCLCCVSKDDDGIFRPTIAGLLLFGKHISIRRVFPMMRIDYIRVDGRDWVRNPDERFQSVDILGPLMTSIPRTISAILDDIPKAFHLPADSDQRSDLPTIPRSAIREAVVNAVMHRSYKHKSPIQIIRYSNRLEIRNPGHSLKPDDRLGEPGSVTRNEKIAAVLHETRYAETKGSGIRAIREGMATANLSPPTFESDREGDLFVATFLFHHFLNPSDVRWLQRFGALGLSDDEQRALVFVREVGAINNSAYRDLNRVETLTASGHLRRLREFGLLEQKGKSTQTFYVPTSTLLEEFKPGRLTLSVSPESIRQPSGLPSIPEPPSPGEAAAFSEIFKDIGALGLKPRRDAVRRIIKRLCAIRPMSAGDLSAMLCRTRSYVSSCYLGPMLQSGEIAYLFPESPAHPGQKYRIP